MNKRTLLFGLRGKQLTIYTERTLTVSSLGSVISPRSVYAGVFNLRSVTVMAIWRIKGNYKAGLSLVK